jgi:serine/threonine protein kinase
MQKSNYKESELRSIGDGGLGKVLFARNKNTEETFAVKVIDSKERI